MSKYGFNRTGPLKYACKIHKLVRKWWHASVLWQSINRSKSIIIYARLTIALLFLPLQWAFIWSFHPHSVSLALSNSFSLSIRCKCIYVYSGHISVLYVFRVPTTFPKSNLSTFQAFSRCISSIFKHITAVAHSIFINSTNCAYSIPIISLLHHIKSDVIVL